ncbi:MAG: hypothetical protein NWE92_03715 [Candidatus Bathyarchaeota archaeon]|nr:hypothetical protein [Candidatus Bathyarchaeota archaeon]
MNVALLSEPKLFFSEKETCTDPQVGLLNYGPYGGAKTKKPEKEKVTIHAGIIGTLRSINAAKSFLERLNGRISAQESTSKQYKGIDFPGLGLNGPLRFEIVIDENDVLDINREFIRYLSRLDRRERIKEAVAKYCEKFDVLAEAHPKPDIILLPLDDELLALCKDPDVKVDRIVYQKRDFGDPESANAPMFDFHHHLKAQAALPRRDFVTQMLNPKTMVFSDERQSAALIAWNFSVGTYYKATGTPWKLADINDDTCYIGISFYREIIKDKMAMRASIAQVYMRTGESQVITGRPFEWDEKVRGRHVWLTSYQMEELVAGSIRIFFDQRQKNPKRLVVHKSTHFSEDEIKGCIDGSKNIDQIDLVHVSEDIGFRAYHHKYDFPVVRGTLITNSKQPNDAMLFTSGYVPTIGTYPGPSAPKPLHLKCQRIDSSIEMISSDILGLSKLDWNSCTFYTRLPVTIGVSEKVGDILAEMAIANISPPTSYRYYM